MHPVPVFHPVAVLALCLHGGAATSNSHDAKVPGTPYEATGPLQCRERAVPRTTACTMGVRRLGPGRAIVDVTFPDGRLRVLAFDHGAVTSKHATVATQRNEDTTVVSLNGGKEVIRVPDAVIDGG